MYEELLLILGPPGLIIVGLALLTWQARARSSDWTEPSGWLAGGGIQGGMHYGKTDDFSYNIVENPIRVRDFHATMLYLLGVDHRRLTYPYQGLDQKLTGVEKSRVVKEIMS